jgi:hypothetical protein
VHAPSLLPAAFYDLSRYSFSQIFECPVCAPNSGVTHTSASSLLPTGAPPTNSSSRVHADCLASQTLSARDLQRLALGKEAATLAVSAVIAGMARGPPGVHTRKLSASTSSFSNGLSSMFSTPLTAGIATATSSSATTTTTTFSPCFTSPACTSPGTCRRDFADLGALATQHYVCERERGCADPLYVAEELGTLQATELAECRACARALEAWAVRERERIWRAIPGWFRIEVDIR